MSLNIAISNIFDIVKQSNKMKGKSDGQNSIKTSEKEKHETAQ